MKLSSLCCESSISHHGLVALYLSMPVGCPARNDSPWVMMHEVLKLLQSSMQASALLFMCNISLSVFYVYEWLPF